MRVVFHSHFILLSLKIIFAPMNVFRCMFNGSLVPRSTSILSLLSYRRTSKINNISRHFSSLPNKKSSDALKSTSKRPIDMATWSPEQVSSRLLSIGKLGEADKKVWVSLRATGGSLNGITQEMLEKRGMTYGSAFEIASEIDKLIGRVLTPEPLKTNPPQTAQELLDFVLNNPKLQGHFKENPAVPVKLAQNRPGFMRVARQTALRDVYSAMTTRLHLRAEKREEGTHDRLSNPLPATWATTGGGKTFFLDELGALRPEDLVLCQDEAMKMILQNTKHVAVPITYNGGSQFNPVIDDNVSNHGLGLAVRALYSYFCGRDNIRFSDFIGALNDVLPSLTLERAVQCISAHAKKGVLLLVDELLKSTASAKQIKHRDVVSQIGDCLDNFTPSEFNVLVTTLNSVVFKGETESGRVISWVRLAPPTQKEAILLFLNDHARATLGIPQNISPGDVCTRLANLDMSRLLCAINSPILAQCIADCNGHFRTLETLKKVWERPNSQYSSYAMLIHDLGQSIDLKYTDLSLPLLKAALRGVAVAPSDFVPGDREGKTYGQYVQEGIFLNTPGVKGDQDTETDDTNQAQTEPKAKVKKVEKGKKGKKLENVEKVEKVEVKPGGDVSDTPMKFIPRVSPLQLILFSRNNIGSEYSEAYLYACIIKSMLDLEPNFNWQQYEEFHAHWENLIRLVHGDDVQHTIKRLYPGILSSNSSNPTFYSSVISSELYHWPTHFPKGAKGQPKFPTGTLSKTILPAAGNPGFDIVRFEPNRVGSDRKSEPLIICTECRFSDPASKTKLIRKQVTAKRNLTIKQFSRYFKGHTKLGGYTLKKENLFLVICAFRNVSAMQSLPENTVVLNRDQLKVMYTPSLSSRPQFLLPLKHGELTKVPE